MISERYVPGKHGLIIALAVGAMIKHSLAGVAILGAMVGCAADAPPPALSFDGKADNVGNEVCQQLTDESTEYDVEDGSIELTKELWKTLDVLVGFDYDECHDHVTQQLIEIDGQRYWRFTTNDDSCDGGNSYGGIYTEDLSTPIAHIYDGDIYCDGWREEDRAINHACDLGAEAFAQDAMNQFGLEFVAESSELELRRPYIYSFVHVTGTLPGHDDKTATVKVLTNLDGCVYGGASIEDLDLD